LREVQRGVEFREGRAMAIKKIALLKSPPLYFPDATFEIIPAEPYA
jgi:hypothetical protein